LREQPKILLIIQGNKRLNVPKKGSHAGKGGGSEGEGTIFLHLIFSFSLPLFSTWTVSMPHFQNFFKKKKEKIHRSQVSLFD